MNKIMFLLLALGLSATAGIAQTLNKSGLCKKWYLKNYEVYWVDYDPEEKEKNDYILFNKDMTYVSVDEGIESKGTWEYNTEKKFVTMCDEDNENLKIYILELEKNEMVIKLDVEELKKVKIHYTTDKN